ncbi:phage tail assembly protein [Devosia naphthalenivorans]|uniref:phage tail assembly protein n=1 Tax=Devosia naphthalenivorans TaxID=2082392 RepID=UPI0013B05F89|nr:phage tail assembly protein [Devosia naphthalenivorans]
MAPTIFTPTAPVTVRGKTYAALTFSRPAGLADIQTFMRYKEPKRAVCAALGQMAGVPGSVVAALSDKDFVRLERETRHLFAVA